MNYFTKGACQSIGVIRPITHLYRNVPEVATFIQVRNYAARKGYREKREKAKVKKEVKKKEFIPRNVLKREL